mmetsp:Transcript_19942/g.33612  ORF Transcript_19942/g.33612 Transcript_19942/m.33612 type:complete len:196 (+) Transcript_19942:48-635(+)
MSGLFSLRSRVGMCGKFVSCRALGLTNVRFLSSFLKSYHVSGHGKQTTTIFNQPSLLTQVVSDVPVAMGGKDKGPEPVELLLASLCGCELVTAQFIARNMKPRVTIDQIDFDIRASRDSRGALGLPIRKDTVLPPSRLERIWGTATLHTSASEDEVELIAEEVKRRCPVANMVMLSGCDLQIEFKKKKRGPKADS